MKPLTLLTALLLLPSSMLAPKVVSIKRGSPDYKAIVQSITPYANVHSPHLCRVPCETMRRSGDWAFVLSSLPCVNPKDQSSGSSLIALLKKVRRWTIREIAVGPSGFDDIESQWEKKHKLPAGLIDTKR